MNCLDRVVSPLLRKHLKSAAGVTMVAASILGPASATPLNAEEQVTLVSARGCRCPRCQRYGNCTPNYCCPPSPVHQEPGQVITPDQTPTPPAENAPQTPFDAAAAQPEMAAPNFNSLSSSYGSVTSPNTGLNMFGDQFARRDGIEITSQGLGTTGNFNLDFAIANSHVPVIIVSPGDGGVVGRTKLSDDNSPLPRDRIMFGFDYFQNVPLTLDGTHVSRFSPGFEKTFLDGLTSLELRVPFAASIDNDMVVGQSSRKTQLGNLSLTAKGLLLAGENGGVASGVQMGLPTANSTTIAFPGNQPFLKIVNQSITLAPYVAFYTTPTPRLFTQFWASTVFDTSGSRVDTDFIGIGTYTPAARMYSQSMMSLDGQIGYRLYNNPNGLLRSLTPFGELHWNSSMGVPTPINANGLTLNYADPHFNELNTTLGANAIWSNNLLTAVGLSLPLRSGNDRTFDYQLGLRLSYFYGPTARQMSQMITTY